MSALAHAVPAAVAAPAPAADPLAALSDQQRADALARYHFIAPALERIGSGVSRRQAAQWLASAAIEAPSSVTLDRWIGKFQAEGLAGLAPSYTGRVRKDYGWELRAAHLYRLPSQPCKSTVALWLRNEGHQSATDSRVRSYLDALPKHVGEFAPSRVGAHFREQNLKPYVVRDASVLPPGLICTTDGHTLDWYTQHPNTGKHFRAEFTPVMDVASRYICGWWLGEAESAVNTLYALTASISRHDHVHASIHVDPGPGFDNKIVDEIRARLGMEVIFALPGNAKGKGVIEVFFRWMEERLGKQLPSYCGKSVPRELMRRLEQRIASGDLVVPSWEETLARIRDFIERYNNSPLPALGGKTPAEVWALREKSPLHIEPASLLRPREKRVARRYGVSLFNRLYRAPELAAYESCNLLVEYDLHDASHVSVFTLAGRYICSARLVEAKPWVPESRIEDLKQKRLAGQKRRLQAHLDEMTARTREAIPHDAHLAEVIEGLPQDTEAGAELVLAAPEPGFTPSRPAAPQGPVLDIYDTSYAEEAAPVSPQEKN